jgi:hypothetical protein
MSFHNYELVEVMGHSNVYELVEAMKALEYLHLMWH